MPRRLKPNAIGQYFEEWNQEGKLLEMHSSTCAHCQKMTEFPSMRRMMEFVDICRNCMKLVCLECHGKPCKPFMKLVEEQEAEAERKRHRRRLGYG